MISQDEDRQKLIRDVQCLTFDAVLIHNSFSEIDEELSLIAAETLSFFDPHLFFRQHVLQFQTDLRGYHQQYRDLLWKSREVAGEASAMLEDFVQNSVPLIRDEKVDIEEKVLLFKIAIDTIPAHEAAAQHATDAFERLYTDLQSALNVWTKLHAQSIQNLSNRENRMGELLRDLVHRVQSKSLGPAREGLNTGRYKNVSQAAREEHVARNTLDGRYHGTHAPRAEAYDSHRLLKVAEEQAILDWMELNATQGRPLNASQLRAYVRELTGKSPGKNWCDRFVARYSDVLVKAKATGLDPTRGKNFNKPTIQHYFEQLAKLEEQYGEIPPNQIWNMDEKGLQLGGGRKGGKTKHFFFRKKKCRYKIRSDNLELVTVIECISAAGEVAPTTFILTDGPYPDIRGVDNVGSVGISESGWTDRGHAASWISGVFLPYAYSQVTDRTKPVLLIVDGHDSHECLEIKGAIYHNLDGHIVIMLCFPSKCTHKVQPLDVVIFSHTQTQWKVRCDALMDVGKKVSRYNVIEEYMAIRDKCMPASLVQQAFAATGIYPRNPNVFTDEDFAPSQCFSVKAHAPSSYPDPVPSSDPAVPSDDEGGDDSNDDSEYHNSDSSDSDSGVDTEDDEGDVEIVDVECFGQFTWCTTMPVTLETSAASELEPSINQDLDVEMVDADSEEPRSWLVTLASDYAQNYNLDVDSDDSDSETADSDTDSEHTNSLEQHESAHVTRSVTRHTFSDHLSEDRFPDLPLDTLKRMSPDDMISHILNIQADRRSLRHALHQTEAMHQSASSHCTIALKQLEEEKTRLANATRKSTRGTGKIKARMVSGPALQTHFSEEEKQAAEKKAADKAKEDAKAAETAARDQRIVEGASSKVFDNALSSYTRKEDLITLARALKVTDTGKNPEIKKRIQEHLQEHPELTENPRFTALFRQGRRRPQPGVENVAPHVPPS
ncbi:hypothetical protein EUX98_g5259 [Antrodiella citrinella]|uniref:HTH CENPB-type domain-containing protein n=1 Tax=Antrodiella citrinella TaxID=2447956 RepID=A0A4S4MS68_9APHY|nr:hypothetical protein EUX98_g5259 [Antrodiella citrinella]